MTQIDPDLAREQFTLTGAELAAQLLRAQADILRHLRDEISRLQPELISAELAEVITAAVDQLDRNAAEAER